MEFLFASSFMSAPRNSYAWLKDKRSHATAISATVATKHTQWWCWTHLQQLGNDLVDTVADGELNEVEAL